MQRPTGRELLEDKIEQAYILVADLETAPELCKFLVKVEIEAEFVLHFDTLLCGQLFEVSLKAYSL